MHPIILFGKEITIKPEMISIGSFSIYWYGFFIVGAIMLSFFLAKRRIEKKKLDFGITLDNLYDFIIGAVLVSILSARLYYVLFNLKYYLANPSEILQIWNGGLAIYGGIIGAIIYSLIFCRRKGIVFYDLADLAAPYLALSQSIGRWGNFVNQEAYGYATNIPWKMGIFDTTVGKYIYVHPTFFYESICNFILFFILMKISQNRRFGGQIFFSYMIGYGIIRSIVEGLRTDSLMLGNFRVSQLLSIVFVILFGIMYYYGEKRRTKDVT